MSTDWEARWAGGDIHWDHGEASPPLAEYLETRAITGRVVVPGCGSGHDVRALTAQGAEAVGMDISPTALRRAGEYPRAGAERYVLGNVLAPPEELQGTFDWVVEHTCFCALEPSLRAAYVRGVRSLLKDGGRLWAVFYINPEAEEGPPFRVSMEELHRLFGRDFHCDGGWAPRRAYEKRVGRERCACWEVK